jgi:uncharacterized protein YaeQ
LRDLTGATRLWVEVGLPDEKPVMRACGRADEVALYAYGHAADVWWNKIKNKLTRPDNLSIYCFDSEATTALAKMAERSMRLSAIIQDGELSISNEGSNLQVALQKLR